MLGGVLQQLGEHHGQRRGHLGGQLAGVALDAEGHRSVGEHTVLGHAHQRAHDVVEVDLLARLPRQDLVHQGDRADAALGLVEGLAPLARRQPAGLQAQQRRDGLQVVLDPVVDLADGGVLRQQQPVPAAQVGDVAHQHQRPGDLPVVEQRDAADQHGDVGPALDLLGHGAAVAKAVRTADSSMPSSSRRMPSVLE